MLIQQNDSVGVARNNKLNYFVAFFFVWRPLCR
jgi:hypothetical protein